MSGGGYGDHGYAVTNASRIMVYSRADRQLGGHIAGILVIVAVRRGASWPDLYGLVAGG